MTQQVETWRLYRFDTSLRCRSGHEHRLYIGISNEPLRRVLEHAKDKPWFRHVTGWTVDERVFYSESDAREAERAAIHAELPLANTVHNLGNPCRMVFDAQPQVPRKVARRASVARAAVAAPRWTPAVKRAAGSHAVRVAAVWLVLAGLLWWAANRAALSAVAGPQYAAAAATGMLLALWAFVERRSRKTKVRFWRACSLLAVAVLAGFVVWPWVGPHWVEFRHWTELQQAVSR